MRSHLLSALALLSLAGVVLADGPRHKALDAVPFTGVGQDGRKVTAVPYYAWDHRKPGEMIVWVRQEGKATTPCVDDPA